MNQNENKKNNVGFPTMERVYDISLKQRGDVRKMAIVRIADGILVNVLNVWGNGAIKQRYVMNTPPGTGIAAYKPGGDYVGSVEDYGMTEQEIVEFVIPYVPDENTPDRDFNQKF